MAFLPLVADTRIVLEAVIQDQDGTAIDLTGGTVNLKYNIAGGALVTATGSITNATGGVAQYEFTDDELTTGVMCYEWLFTDSAGKEFMQNKLQKKQVRSRLS